MPEHLLHNSVQPFVCCAEPVADLSHDAWEVLGLDDPLNELSPFTPGSYNVREGLDADELLFAVYSEENVFAPLEVTSKNDPTTYQHAIRVGNCAARTAVLLGLATAEAKIAVRAALLHDHGKLHPGVQRAIHSTRTVQNDPSLYDAIQTHPWHGVRLLAPYRHSRNVLQVVGNHHSLQTERPAYGVFSSVMNLPEADGYQPDTRRLLEIVAASDLFDALWIAPRLGERRYQQFTKEAYESLSFLEVALGSLKISDEVYAAVYDLAANERAVTK